MSAPAANWCVASVKEWRSQVKTASSLPRPEYLKVIASGPCDSEQVQAARRLLCKPRYQGNTK